MTDFQVPEYKVWSEDLSTGQTTPKEFQIESSYLEFTKVDKPVTLRIGARNAPARTVSNPCNFCFKGEPVRSIFLSWEEQSGTVEFTASEDIESGFNGANAASGESDSALAQYLPYQHHGSNLYVRNRLDFNATQVLTEVSTGAFISTPRPGAFSGLRRLGGFNVLMPASGTDDQQRIEGPEVFDGSIFQVIQDGVSAYVGEGPDWGFYIEDTFALENSGSGWILFGIGYHYSAVGWDRAFIGFRFNPTAQLMGPYAVDDAGVTHISHSANPITGYDCGKLHRWRMEWGMLGGTPFLKFLADGNVVYEATVPFPAVFDAGSQNMRAPFYHFRCNDLTSTHSLEVSGALGQGCKYGEFTPS